jgi:hypothetical protein
MDVNQAQNALIVTALNTSSVIIQSTDEDSESVEHEAAWRDRLDQAIELYVEQRVPGVTIDLGPRRVHAYPADGP